MTSTGPPDLPDQMRAYRALRLLSLWLMSGPLLWIAWLISRRDTNADAWNVIGGVWLAISHAAVLLALGYGYWRPRAVYWRRGGFPFHLRLWPAYPLLPLTFVYGLFANLALIVDVDGESPALFAFTVGTFGVAALTQADWFLALRQLGKHVERIEQAVKDL